jgi:hypothetical protein
MVEELTGYEIVQLAAEHYDEIEKIWMDGSKVKNLAEAIIEWGKRHGREIVYKSSKTPGRW